MSDDRQHQLARIAQRLRDMQTDEFATPADLRRYIAGIHERLLFSPAEQLHLATSIGDANLFQDANVAVGNITGGDFTQKQQSGGVDNTGATINAMRDMVAGDKVVNQFFGGKAPADGQRLLTAYLHQIVKNTSDLHLYRMTRAQSGSGQSLLPPIKLADVYTNVVVDGDAVRLGERTRPANRARKLSERIKNRTVDEYPPEQVRIFDAKLDDATAAAWRERHPHTEWTWEAIEDNVLIQLALHRPPLALEAIAHNPRLVLLGDPGYGKSTLLRYLALMLAQHQLGAASPLPLGWQERGAVVPLFCALAAVANGLHTSAADVRSDTRVLWQALEQQLEGLTTQGEGLRDYLRDALARGSVVVLLDGLDELSAVPDATGVSLRARMSAAIGQLGQDLPHVPMVVTCRVLPYVQPIADEFPRNTWHLPPDWGWTTRIIQPFVLGQVRQFVQAWYTSAAESAQPRYTLAASTERATALLQELEQPRLRVLTSSPLLLTMLAILHYNSSTSLPTTEAELYEHCVALLLERWEPVRTLEHPKPGLLEELGLAGSGKKLGDIRSILHTVAFEAHNRPPKPGDGRGIVRHRELVGELYTVFTTWRCEAIPAKVATFVRVLRENAALLHELDDDGYAFPHLTFQEFLAACELTDSGDLPRAYRVWSSADSDRWRKVLLLFAGRLRATNTVQSLGKDWLDVLLRHKMPADKHGHCAAKTMLQRQRDALLAAESYAEFDRRTALSKKLDAEELDALERSLAHALVTVLQPEPLATTLDRVAAGDALASLGDPRRGVCDLDIDWCDVAAGDYTLGSDDYDRDADSDEKPLQTVHLAAFRISRYPVTNAQWRLFMEEGGYTKEHWWQHGWAQRESNHWTEPSDWGDARFNAPNQPVVGVSWYEAQAFCAWLAQTRGHVVTLPTEAQWEAAARGLQRPIYPWGDAWDADRANTNASNLNRTTAVGCYPQGASWCEALDMSGNVWEWTRSAWANVDRANEIDIINNSAYVSIRGGSWNFNRSDARCAYRFGNGPHYRFFNLGLRLVAE